LRRRDFVGSIAAVIPCMLRGEQAPGPALPTYVDIASRAGVKFRCETSRTSQKYLIETMVGGVAMFDYDGDGRMDLYFVNGAALQESMDGREPDKSDPRFWNRLYRNNGDGTFTDVTDKAGVRGHSYGQGVAIGDYDNDGHEDIYVTNYGRNILYHNNGDGTFTDVTEKAGVGGGGWSAAACFVDYDRDGLLDLVVSRYLDWNIHKNPWCGDESRNFRGYCHPEVFPPVTHILYHNNGNGTFTDVTKRAGLANLPGNGLGIAINDFDGDGWLDILVANDALPQQLFRNNHDGTFTEVAMPTGLAYDEDGKVYSGMGIAFEDYDNDGWPDVFIGNLANQKWALYKNRKGSFEYVTPSTGLGAISMMHSAWGVHFADYDNDGWKDLLVAQSHVMDNIERTQPSLRYLEPLSLLRNVNGKFQDVSAQSGEPFRIPVAARGIAFGDLDNDGFIDMAVNCLDGNAMVLRNNGNGNNWIMIDPVGTVSNRDGIGARLHIITDSGMHQYAMANTAGSYFSASDRRVHFGLAKDKQVRILEITWPNGATQKLGNLLANKIHRIEEPRNS